MTTAINRPAETPRRARLSAVARRWRGEVPVFAITLLLVAVCIGLLTSKGVTPSLGGIFVNAQIYLAFALVFGFYDLGRELYQHKPQSPLAHLKAYYTSPKVTHAVIGGTPLLAVAVFLMPYFSMMKSAIPLFNDYSWDATFIAWDRALFFGQDAWAFVQPVLGFPAITALLALLYHLWILLIFPGVMFFAFAKIDTNIRRQFFVSYVLCWALIGGLMATMLASVGPVFLEPILGDTTFKAQMAYLYAANDEVPVMVLSVQELLLERFYDAENELGSGITAMPSMHCAIAFLYWIAVRELSPKWGAFFGIFCFITWISSFHLAYHYAVDGLVSFAAVSVIWFASKRLFAAWDGYLASRNQATLRTKTVPTE